MQEGGLHGDCGVCVWAATGGGHCWQPFGQAGYWGLQGRDGEKVLSCHMLCVSCDAIMMRELAPLARPLSVLHHVKVATCHCLLIPETTY